MGDQHLLAHSGIRRPITKQIQQIAIIRHGPVPHRMRPVAAPHATVGTRGDQRLRQRIFVKRVEDVAMAIDHVLGNRVFGFVRIEVEAGAAVNRVDACRNKKSI